MRFQFRMIHHCVRSFRDNAIFTAYIITRQVTKFSVQILNASIAESLVYQNAACIDMHLVDLYFHIGAFMSSSARRFTRVICVSSILQLHFHVFLAYAAHLSNLWLILHIWQLLVTVKNWNVIVYVSRLLHYPPFPQFSRYENMNNSKVYECEFNADKC